MLARTSPAGFAYTASHGQWIPARHLLMLSERIVDVAMGRCPRLIVTMPPRHGKSELISKYTPAWYLGNFPDKKVMLASYADTFAAHWGRRSREVMEEWGPRIFGAKVNAELRSGAQWELDRTSPALRDLGEVGLMVTAGVGGGLTGKGANLLIIDDPVKNSEEAHSEKIRESHYDWWRSTARTRLQKGGGVILVMTRWHEDDLAGRMLRDSANGEGDHWELLNLPGLAEPGDHLGRNEGEALWPEMFDLENLEQTRKAMGTYWFTAMYQQRPAPLEGALFKKNNFRYYTKTATMNPTDDGPELHELATIHKDSGDQVFDVSYGRKFCTVDVAASESAQADFTVVSTWVVTLDRDLLLWDRERVQFEGPDLAPLIRRVYAEQKPSLIGIERVGYGLTLIQELLREGLPIVRLEPDKDKVSRALPAAARLEEKRVFFPKHVSWLDEWESELLVFPNGAHDDQVDTLAYAALQLPTINAGTRSGYEQRSKGNTITGGVLSEQF